MRREDFNQKMQELRDRTPLDIVKNIDEMLKEELSEMGKVAVLAEVGSLILALEKSDDEERQKALDYIYVKSKDYAIVSMLSDMFDSIFKGVTNED